MDIYVYACELRAALLCSTKSTTSRKGPPSSGDLQGSPERLRAKSHDWIAVKNSGERADLFECHALVSLIVEDQYVLGNTHITTADLGAESPAPCVYQFAMIQIIMRITIQ